MKLIVGLGNPGRKYEATRHNAGFWFADRVARLARATFRPESRYHGAAVRASFPDGDIWLLKPETYMNESGRAVGALAGFFKVAPSDVLVAHDEVDLQPGTARLKFGGGMAGHNGLRSIVATLGTRDFWRLRIGVGHPRELTRSEQEVVDFVLHAPSAAEQSAIDGALDRVMAVWPMIGAGDMEGAMLRLHTREEKDAKEPKQPKDTKGPE